MISKVSAAQLIPENLLLYDITKSTYILQVEVDPIDYCNHKCKWCFTANFRHNKQLSLIDLKKYLSHFYKSGGKSVVFSGGGEPLLYKYIYTKNNVFDNSSICRYLINHNIYIGIITNGLFLSQLFKSDFNITDLSFIRVSLDATDSQDHVLLHNARYCDFDNIITNINTLIYYRGKNFTPAIGVSFVVDSDSGINCYKKQIANICKLARNLNIDFVQFKHVHTNDYGTAVENMKTVHSFCQEMNWGSVEFWIQSYEAANISKHCLITQYIQSVGNDSRKFPCCHLFGRSELLDQSVFLPVGQIIMNCKNKVCRYKEVNEILSDDFLSKIKNYHLILNESLNNYGFHPYRYCPTAPNIMKPFKS